MKVLAILDLAPGVQLETVRAQLEGEIKCSWGLYASGALREVYATAIATRVVFVLESENQSAAEKNLRLLPLVAAGLFKIELIELRPFVNWSRLFAQ
ncbi:MAG TPA: hypothetical protein VGD54_11015 [Steroidobacteraceae bacterium]